MFGSRIDKIIKNIKSANEKRREKAYSSLEEFSKSGLSEEDATKLLHASVGELPPRKSDWEDPSECLVSAAGRKPYPSLLPAVKEIYPQLRDEPRAVALTLISKIENEDATHTYVNLIKEFDWPDHLYPAMIISYQQAPRHEKILFPDLVLNSKGIKGSMMALDICLCYCQASLIDESALEQIQKPLLETYDLLRTKVQPYQTKEGMKWIWDDEYSESRYSAGLLLDLMTYFKSAEVVALLKEASEFRDPRLSTIAVTSLVGQDIDVSAAKLVKAAASAEMRLFLHSALKRLGQLELYPEEFNSQEAFAEADMVNWLCFPTELGRAPDEMELMKTVSLDTETPDGIIEYFIYRFRTDPPHWAADDGWMAGISGPFIKKDGPSPDAHGETFSTFDPWDSMSADEHLGDIQKIMDDWRKHHSKK